MTNIEQSPPASLLKRIMAILYDLLLLIAIFFVVGIVLSSLTTFIVNDGNAITEEHPFYISNQIIILVALVCTSIFFYGWFWIHGGQTLGMKTWRIRLLSNDNQPLSWKQVLQRYFCALLSWGILGLGFLWSLIDGEKRCWHDIASSSRLIQLDKN